MSCEELICEYNHIYKYKLNAIVLILNTPLNFICQKLSFICDQSSLNNFGCITYLTT